MPYLKTYQSLFNLHERDTRYSRTFYALLFFLWPFYALIGTPNSDKKSQFFFCSHWIEILTLSLETNPWPFKWEKFRTPYQTIKTKDHIILPKNKIKDHYQRGNIYPT